MLGAPSATRAVVVGGGTMGADVAVVLLRARCAATVVEPRHETHAAIREKIAANLRALGREDNLGLLRVVEGLEQVDWPSIGLVIECVPEVLDIKRELFSKLNAAYVTTFGFPFIIAVKGKTKEEILAEFETRIGNSRGVEFETACKQVERIALLRLKDMLPQ